MYGDRVAAMNKLVSKTERVGDCSRQAPHGAIWNRITVYLLYQYVGIEKKNKKVEKIKLLHLISAERAGDFGSCRLSRLEGSVQLDLDSSKI